MRCNQEIQDLRVRKSLSNHLFFFLKKLIVQKLVLGWGQSSQLCFVQPAHGRKNVNAKMQHTILGCCKEQPLGMVFSLLIVYSHHHPSHSDYKRVEMSSHQTQTLFECAIYLPLTVFQVVQIVLRLHWYGPQEYLLRNMNSLCCMNSIFPLFCLTYICFLCLASFILLCL